jgi:hypothetical protein
LATALKCCISELQSIVSAFVRTHSHGLAAAAAAAISMKPCDPFDSCSHSAPNRSAARCQRSHYCCWSAAVRFAPTPAAGKGCACCALAYTRKCVCARPPPPPSQLAKRVLEDFPSPYHALTEGGHTPGEGADFLLGEVTDTVTRVRTEQGLLTYLSCLKALGGAPHLKSLKAITRLRLQSELYSLTSPGVYCFVCVCGGGG